MESSIAKRCAPAYFEKEDKKLWSSIRQESAGATTAFFMDTAQEHCTRTLHKETVQENQIRLRIV
ncbi:hypothetical protein [Holdemania sp. Marseille-P2844]|uniref:hypothetical protein n=1 Tax=Holdemania sp. Marseille-P2844 TaxID=1852366 RepID=UPI001114C64C|nr:hypothetical protein [Holdemania sp. Marseille-P2844]